ncbi:hypothetical protein DFJ74DRAFT_753260 [Hyaloraphidium curvatum]|nr:hypothetical protein DFJ74DRAFT_753260 [Hyaloraphidium curvatum]
MASDAAKPPGPRSPSPDAPGGTRRKRPPLPRDVSEKRLLARLSRALPPSARTDNGLFAVLPAASELGFSWASQGNLGALLKQSSEASDFDAIKRHAIDNEPDHDVWLKVSKDDLIRATEELKDSAVWFPVPFGRPFTTLPFLAAILRSVVSTPPLKNPLYEMFREHARNHFRMELWEPVDERPQGPPEPDSDGMPYFILPGNDEEEEVDADKAQKDGDQGEGAAAAETETAKEPAPNPAPERAASPAPAPAEDGDEPEATQPAETESPQTAPEDPPPSRPPTPPRARSPTPAPPSSPPSDGLLHEKVLAEVNALLASIDATRDPPRPPASASLAAPARSPTPTTARSRSPSPSPAPTPTPANPPRPRPQPRSELDLLRMDMPYLLPTSPRRAKRPPPSSSPAPQREAKKPRSVRPESPVEEELLELPATPARRPAPTSPRAPVKPQGRRLESPPPVRTPQKPKEKEQEREKKDAKGKGKPAPPKRLSADKRVVSEGTEQVGLPTPAATPARGEDKEREGHKRGRERDEGSEVEGIDSDGESYAPPRPAKRVAVVGRRAPSPVRRAASPARRAASPPAWRSSMPPPRAKNSASPPGGKDSSGRYHLPGCTVCARCAGLTKEKHMNAMHRDVVVSLPGGKTVTVKPVLDKGRPVFACHGCGSRQAERRGAVDHVKFCFGKGKGGKAAESKEGKEGGDAKEASKAKEAKEAKQRDQEREKEKDEDKEAGRDAKGKWSSPAPSSSRRDRAPATPRPRSPSPPPAKRAPAPAKPTRAAPSVSAASPPPQGAFAELAELQQRVLAAREAIRDAEERLARAKREEAEMVEAYRAKMKEIEL